VAIGLWQLDRTAPEIVSTRGLFGTIIEIALALHRIYSLPLFIDLYILESV